MGNYKSKYGGGANTPNKDPILTSYINMILYKNQKIDISTIHRIYFTSYISTCMCAYVCAYIIYVTYVVVTCDHGHNPES